MLRRIYFMRANPDAGTPKAPLHFSLERYGKPCARAEETNKS
jgi:hypothetical protein